MSKSVDERVVRMEFENKNFEANAKATMSTIDKLKEKLNFTGAAKGVKEIDTAAKSINLSSLASGVELISKRFTTLGIVGVTALQNITNQVLRTAQNMMNQFTLAPIMSGFSEYETQLNSVQTILANTSMQGTTLRDVNAALDELNTYADKTIYNFTEMTRNIGTFTAAGVDLKTSTEAIKGIANLAAMSGSSSQQASTAMYQLSQALAAGRVSLQDWNSVVNAGMGGKVFQDALKNTAKAMGIVVDESVSFRESISTTGGKESWLTSDVLLNTLRQFTGDLSDAELATMGFNQEQIKAIQLQAQTAQEAATKVKTFTQLIDTTKEAIGSGWTQTWEIIFGDFEEARNLWTNVSNVINDAVGQMSDARNSLLQSGLGSSWDQITEEVQNAGVTIEDFENAVTETAEKNGVAIDSLIEKYGSLSAAFAAGELSSNVVVQTLETMTGTTEDLTGKLEKFQEVVDAVWNGDYGNGTARIDALTKAGYDYAKVQELVNKSANGYRLTLDDISDSQLTAIGYTDEEIAKLRELGSQAKNSSTDFGKLIDQLNRPTGRQNIISGLSDAFRSLALFIKPIRDGISDVFEAISGEDLYNATVSFRNFFSELYSNLSENTKLFNQVHRIVSGVASIFDLFAKVAGSAATLALRVFGKVVNSTGDGVLEFVATIGDAITAFNDWVESSGILTAAINAITSVINPFLDAVKSVITSVQEWASSNSLLENVFNFISTSIPKVINKIKSFFTTIGNSTIFQKFSALASKAIETVLKAFSSFGNKISEIFENVFKDGFSFEALIEAFKEIIQILPDFVKTFADSLSGLSSYYTDFAKSIDPVVIAVSDGFGNLKDLINSFIDFLKQTFSGTGVGEILTVGLAVSMIMGINAITKTISSLQSLIKTVTGPFGALKTMLTDIGSAITGLSKSIQTKMKGEAFLSIAIGIGILAASLAALSFVDQDNLRSAAVTLGVFAAGLLGLSKALGLFDAGGAGGLKIDNLTTIFLAISASIFIIIKALRELDGLNLDGIEVKLGILAGIAAGMAAVIIAISKLGGKFEGSALAIVAIGASMWLVVNSLQMLDDVNADAIMKNLGAIVTIFSMLGVVLVAAHGLKFTAGAGVLSVVLSLAAFMGALYLLSKMDMSGIEASLELLSTIFGMLSIVLVASSLAGKNASKAGVLILGMSASLLIIAEAIRQLASIDDTQIQKASGVIAGMFAIFAGITAVSKFAGENAAKAGVGILAMSAALILIAGAMKVIATIDEQALGRSTAVVAGLMIVFGAVIALSHFATPNQATIVAITGSIVALVGVMAVLSLVAKTNTQGLYTAVTCMSILMIVFAAVIAASKLATKCVGPIVTMTIAIVALAGVLTALSMLDVQNSLQNAAALSLLMLAMVAAMQLGRGLNPGAAAQVALAIAAFVGIISALALVVTAIAGLIGQIPGIDQFISKAQEVVTGIFGVLGSMVGGFIGGIAGGAATVFTSTLPMIGEGISAFGESIKPFIEMLKSVDQASVEGAARLIGIIGSMAASSFISAISNILSGGSTSLSLFSSQLSEFATNVQTFCDEISKINEDDLEKGTKVIETFSALAEALPNEGGLIQAFTGGQMDFEEFGDQLGSLADGLSDYCEEVSGIDTSGVSASIDAIRSISSLGPDMPNMVGIAQIFTGGQMDLATFGEQLWYLGDGLVTYCDQVKSLDTSGISTSVDAIRSIASLGPDMPNFVGFAQVFTGGQMDFATFSDQIAYLADGLVSYCESINDLDTTNLDTSIQAIRDLAALGTAMPDFVGFAGYFTGGQMDLSEFGTQITNLGSGIASYCESIKDLDTTNLATSIQAIRDLTTLSAVMPQFESILSVFTGGTMSLSDFGYNLYSLGDGLASYCTSIVGKDFSNVGTSIDALKQIAGLYDVMPQIEGLFSGFSDHTMTFDELSGQLSSLGYGISSFYEYAKDVDVSQITLVVSGLQSFATFLQSISGISSESAEGFVAAMTNLSTISISSISSNFTTGIQELTPTFQSLGKNLANMIINGFNQELPQFKLAGNQGGTNVSAGINDEMASARTAGTNLANSAYTAIISIIPLFKDAGRYAGQGFVEGMNEYASKAAEEASKIAQSAVDAINTALDAHSPSRKTFQSGVWGGQGLALGFKSMGAVVSNAASGVSDGAVKAITESMERANRIIQDADGVQPVIRPVLDMTDVQSKAGMINSMLSRRYSISGTYGMVTGAGSMISNRQNGIKDGKLSEKPKEVIKSFNFTQNNYSPKALNRSEIYRQTNNQFTKLKNKVTGR